MNAEVFRARCEHELELNRATAEFERAALQPGLLANGGAIVAVLALIGAVAGKDADKSAVLVDPKSIRHALMVYSTGFVIAALATLIGYLSQRGFTVAARINREDAECRC